MFLFRRCFTSSRGIRKDKPDHKKLIQNTQKGMSRQKLQQSLINETCCESEERIPHDSLYLLGKEQPIFIKITDAKADSKSKLQPSTSHSNTYHTCNLSQQKFLNRLWADSTAIIIGPSEPSMALEVCKRAGKVVWFPFSNAGATISRPNLVVMHDFFKVPTQVINSLFSYSTTFKV